MTERKHLPALDGVRGLAVLLVFTFHFGGGTHSSVGAVRAFGLLNKAGWSGVTLFFVLSGFLITGILWDSFGDRRWWTNFVVRRSLRIFPLYFLALTLVAISSIPSGGFRAVLHHLWVPVLFLQDIPRLGPIAESSPSPLPIFHLWSIAVEEQFYLFWPFLLVMQKSRKQAKALCGYTMLGGCSFLLLVRIFVPQADPWNHFLLSQIAVLAAGGWIALAYRGPEWRQLVRLAPATLLLGFTGFLACAWVSGSFELTGLHMAVWGLPSITLCFASVLALTLQPGPAARLFSVAPLRGLGKISYGVYVFHILLLNGINAAAVASAGKQPTMIFLVVRFVLAAAISVSAALLSYRFYEKQFLKLKRRFTSTEREKAAPGPRAELQTM